MYLQTMGPPMVAGVLQTMRLQHQISYVSIFVVITLRYLQVLVSVMVTDVDDEIARFDRSWYRFDVVENQPGGAVVGRVSAVDLDLPPFNGFHYQLVAPSGEQPQNNAGY